MSLRALSSTSVPDDSQEITWRDSFILRVIFVFLFVQASGFSNVIGRWASAFHEIVRTWKIPGIQPYLIGALLIAIPVALVWVLLDRRRPFEREIYHIAQIIARLILVDTMFHFGIWKVFHTFAGVPAQLWPPLPADLITPFGQYTPGYFYWEWPGVAPTYVTFTWVVELGGAVLLLFNRTVLLGTLLNLASILNIAVMRMEAYNDLPFWGGERAASFWTSARYLPAVAAILYDQWPRIRAFLFADHVVVPHSRPFVWRNRWVHYTVTILVVLVVARMIETGNWWKYFATWSNQRTRWATDATYRVDSFAVNGTPLVEAEAHRRWIRVSMIGCTANARTLDDTEIELSVVSSGSGEGPDPDCVPTPRSYSSWNQFTAKYGAHTYEDTAHYARTGPDRIELVARVGDDTIVAIVRLTPDEENALWDPRWFWALETPRALRSIVPPLKVR